MPVKIVTDSPSPGQITAPDLAKMKDDFINEADVKPFNGRPRLIKKFSVSLMKNEFKDLISYYEDLESIDFVKLNFAITLNPFTACNGDESDSMTIVGEAATFIDPENPSMGHVAHSNIGDYVIIPGYKSSSEHDWLGSDPCCPSSDPGHPGHP